MIVLVIILTILSVAHSEVDPSASSSLHFTDVCSASQVVELVFNSTSGRYEYWDVPLDAEQVDGLDFIPPDRDGMLGADRNDEKNNKDKSTSPFVGGEYDGETKNTTTDNRTDEKRRNTPPDPSNNFSPKISAGRFRNCACQRRYGMSSSAETNFTLDESLRNSVTINDDEIMYVVCPLTADVCEIPLDDDGTASTGAKCFIPNKKSVVVIRNIWPLLLVWYTCFVSFLLCSYRGRHAILFCFRNTCGPRLNDRIATSVLHRLDQHAADYRRQLRRRRRRNGFMDDSHDDDSDANSFLWRAFWGRRLHHDEDYWNALDQPIGTPPPEFSNPIKELILPTKIYRRKKCCSIGADVEIGLGEGGCGNESATLDDGSTRTELDASLCCTICFVDFDEGDRIGDLKCRHLYHVHCLKKWIGRRNVCPLCRSPLAAETEPALVMRTL